MFGQKAVEEMAPNVLMMRVQPNEGISLSFEVKTPGRDARAHAGSRDHSGRHGLHLRRSVRERRAPGVRDAAARLHDRRPTLFTRSDEVEMAWEDHRPVLEYWDKHPDNYAADLSLRQRGPKEADKILDGDHTRWR